MSVEDWGIKRSVSEVAEGNLRHSDLSETRLKAKGLLGCRDKCQAEDLGAKRVDLSACSESVSFG